MPHDISLISMIAVGLALALVTAAPAHPLAAVALSAALRHLQRELRMGPVPVERCLDCGPGA